MNTKKQNKRMGMMGRMIFNIILCLGLCIVLGQYSAVAFIFDSGFSPIGGSMEPGYFLESENKLSASPSQENTEINLSNQPEIFSAELNETLQSTDVNYAGLNTQELFEILISSVSGQIEYLDPSKEYKDGWRGTLQKLWDNVGRAGRWYQTGYSSFDTSSVFTQEEILNSLIEGGKGLFTESDKVKSISRVDIRGIKGVRIDFEKQEGVSEQVFVLPHITSSSYNPKLVVICAGSNKKESELEDSISSLSQDVKGVLQDLAEGVDVTRDEKIQRANDLLVAELNRGTTVEDLIKGDVKKFGEIFDMNTPIPKVENLLRNAGEYSEDGFYVELPSINFTDLADNLFLSYVDNDNLDLNVGMKTTSQSMNLLDMGSIDFNFKLTNFDNPWVPKLVVKLVSGYKKAVAVREIQPDINEQIRLKREDFNLPEGFNWIEVEKVEVGLRIELNDDVKNNPAISSDVSFEVKDLELTNKSHSLGEILDELKKREIMRLSVSELFNKAPDEFNYLLEKSINPIYSRYYYRYITQVDDGFYKGNSSLYQTMLNIRFSNKNIEFLADQKEDFIKSYGFVLENDYEMLEEFEERLLNRLNNQYGYSEWEAMTFLSEDELKKIQQSVWLKYIPDLKESKKSIPKISIPDLEAGDYEIKVNTINYDGETSEHVSGSFSIGTGGEVDPKIEVPGNLGIDFGAEDDDKLKNDAVVRLDAVADVDVKSYELEVYRNGEKLDDLSRNVRTSNPSYQRKIEDFLINDVIPRSTKYLGATEVGEGSVYHNVIYWVGSRVYKYYDFSSEEIAEVNNLSSSEKEKVKQRLGVDGLSDSWVDRIEIMAKQQVAIRGVLEQMRADKKNINEVSFARYLSEKYYDWEDLESISEELNARMRIKGKLGEVFGTPGITYQQDIKEENITDEKFLDMMLNEMSGFMFSVYDSQVDDDGKVKGSGLIFDTQGAPDANVAAMGLGLASMAALYDEGKLFDPSDSENLVSEEEVKKMLNHSIDALIEIQDGQPTESFHHLEALFGSYPFIVIEQMVNKLEDGSLTEGELNRYDMKDLKDLIDEIGDEIVDKGIYDRKVLDIKFGKNGEIGDNKGLKRQLDEEDLNILKKHIGEITSEDMERVEKYGWGGWLYHYVSPVEDDIPVRSRENVELSPVDTALCVMGMKYAAAVFPELKDKVNKFLSNININTELLWKQASQEDKADYYNIMWTTDLSRDSDILGFGKSNWRYKGSERIILDMMRIMWKVNNYGIDDYSEEFYPEGREPVSIAGIGGGLGHVPSDQNSGWTFEYAPNIYNFLGKVQTETGLTGAVNWFKHTINAFVNNRHVALNAEYPVYGAWISSQELPQEGYIMSQGYQIRADGMVSYTSPNPDGTFSPYSSPLSYMPFESITSLWHQYISNPRLSQGEYGFRDSYNEDQDFISPANYTLNMVNFIFKVINAKSGGVWKTTEEDEDFSQAMKAAGFSGSFEEPTDKEIEEYIESLNEQDGSVEMGGLEDLRQRYEDAEEPGERAVLGYEIAERRVQQVVNITKAMRDSRNEMGVSIFRYYLDKNDEYYEEALGYLPFADGITDDELKVKVKALEFVIAKNQYYYLEQKEKFNELVDIVGGDENLIEVAKDIITSYDYEASVMWKDWDAEKEEYVPIISAQQIEEDLRNPGQVPRTSCYPELEEYANSPYRFYTLFPEESGILSPYVEGMDYSVPLIPGLIDQELSTEHLPGVLEIVEEKGWNEAMDIYMEYLEFQAELRPVVEKLLARRLDLKSPSGDDAGFLSGLANEVIGGLSSDGSNTLDEEIKKIKYWARFMIISDKSRGAKHDLVYETGTQEHEDIIGEFNEIWKGYTTGKSHYLEPEEGISLIQGKAQERPLLYFATSEKKLSPEVSHRNINGESVLVLEGENNKIPILLNNWYLPNQLKFNLKGDDTFSGDIELVVRNGSGEEARYKIKNLNDNSWQEINIPLWGPYNVPWMSDEENAEWQGWLMEEFWQEQHDGTFILKDNPNIVMESDNISNWSNIEEIQIEKINSEADIYMKGIYCFDEEEKIDSIKTFWEEQGKGYFEDKVFVVDIKDGRSFFVTDVGNNEISYVRVDNPMSPEAAQEFWNFRRAFSLFEYKIQSMSLDEFKSLDIESIRFE